MIKFYRKIRQRLLSENLPAGQAGKFSKYLIYAVGEIILVVIGILIAVSINNWNESKKELHIQKQLIGLLISDLDEKKKENLRDSEATKRIINNIKSTINIWEVRREIDTTNLKSILGVLGSDAFFQNENSPIYSGLSSSNFWKQIPDSLTKQIDDIYRIRLMRVKITFEKINEHGTHCIMNFLTPNDLIELDNNVAAIHNKVAKVKEEFILYSKLL